MDHRTVQPCPFCGNSFPEGASFDQHKKSCETENVLFATVLQGSQSPEDVYTEIRNREEASAIKELEKELEEDKREALKEQRDLLQAEEAAVLQEIETAEQLATAPPPGKDRVLDDVPLSGSLEPARSKPPQSSDSGASPSESRLSRLLKDVERITGKSKVRESSTSTAAVASSSRAVPSAPTAVVERDDVPFRRPFFLFENVECAPRGSWPTMERHLYGVSAEAVQSRDHSACSRARKYIHNLPKVGRVSSGAKRIQDVLPQVAAHWPVWDHRTFLNCVNTKEPPSGMFYETDQEMALKVRNETYEVSAEAKASMHKWNLVWTAYSDNTPRLRRLVVEEIETVMGFPSGHTAPALSEAARVRCLGESFQVDTIVYLLSPLRHVALFKERGIRVLSLFDGIAGAGVALSKLGIRIAKYWAVEIDPKCKEVVRNWWQSGGEREPQGLEQIDDVCSVTYDRIESMMAGGGIDLVIGGSPCNDLTGSVRGRVGLNGSKSVLFFEYSRVLHDVEFLARKRAPTDR
jgi:site-specific DNA-cytosine methylase